MEHRARNLHGREPQTTGVHPLAQHRMSCLGQVDANLVLSPGLQRARDEGRAPFTRECDEGSNVGDRPACPAWFGTTLERATKTVAAVVHELRVDGARSMEVPLHEGDVRPVDRVASEEPGEVSLGEPGAAEDQKPRGVPVESVHHEEGRVRGGEPPTVECHGETVDERAALSRVEGHRVDPRWFVHHHHVRILEDQASPRQHDRWRAPRAARRAGHGNGRPRVDGDHVAELHAGAGLGVGSAVDRDLAAVAEPPGLRPGDLHHLADKGAERGVVTFLVNRDRACRQGETSSQAAMVHSRAVASGLKHCPTCNLRYPPEGVRCIVCRTPLTLVPDPLLGAVLGGKYVIEGILGAGGMATVYRAHVANSDRAVAVKVFRRELTNDLKLRERFRREATSTRRLAHPNIVEIIDQGDMDDGVPFMVTELLEGMTLEAWLKQNPGPMPLPMLLDRMAQVLAGLARAHDFQVIHRDLKPDNLFITTLPDGNERMKILDFGIARCMLDSRLTGTGEIFGTPQYMAPERITGTEAGPAADLYALGCILYRCATGQLPFQGSDVTAYLIHHLRDTPPSPRSINPELPEDLDALILRCLEKEPDRRPADARAMERAIAALAQRHPRPRRRSGVQVAPTPIARSLQAQKSTVQGGMFTAMGVERWGRRTELLSAMVLRAFPQGAEARYYAALGRMRATVTAMAGVHGAWLSDQARADAVAERTRDAQQRFGHAMDALSADLHTAREALERTRAAMAGCEAKARPHIDPFVTLHASIVALGPTPALPPRELYERYQSATRALADALPHAEALRDVQAEHAQAEREVRDLEFQIEALRQQLERVSLQGEDELKGIQRRLEIAATQLAAMEAELLKDAGELTEALRGRRELDDLFAELEADAA